MIIKHGKVTITEDSIEVTKFVFNSMSREQAEEEVLKWVIRRFKEGITFKANFS